MDKAAYLDFVVEIVKRVEAESGFEAVPRRWVVERTFGWMPRWRRLVRDCEARIDVAEAMIHLSMGTSCCGASPVESFQTGSQACSMTGSVAKARPKRLASAICRSRSSSSMSFDLIS